MNPPWQPKLLIAGAEVADAQPRIITDPRTETPAFAVPCARATHLEQALQHASAAFPAWAALGFEARSKHLQEIARRVSSERERFVEVLRAETGKSAADSNAEVDVFAYLVTQQVPVRPRAGTLEETAVRTARLEFRPLGIVASIGAWNYPLVMIAQKCLAALHAGNCVIYKPSPYTPASALLLAELVEGALPSGVLTILPGDDALGEALVRDPRIAKVSFTGSTQTGRRVMEASGATLKHLTLELGGNDAAIVTANVDVVEVAERIFQRAFFNAGQTCTAIKRLLVHASIARELTRALAELCLRHRLQPLQNAAQLAAVESAVADARTQGATVEVGGLREARAGYWYLPTLLTRVTSRMNVWQQECFGPVLPIREFSDDDEAIALANDSIYGLGGSVWSRDARHAEGLASRIEAGTVWINDHGDVQAHLPFAPSKQSGVGVEYGAPGLEACMAIRVLNVHHGSNSGRS